MPNESFTRGGGDGWVTFGIPADVKMLRNVVIRGGGSPNNRSGQVTGTIDVKPSDAIIMYLGEAGSARSGNTGGAGGASGSAGGSVRVGAGGKGGDGNTGTTRAGNGGGSATAIWLRDTSKPGNLGRLLAVAGGAGGDSGNGGDGGLGGAAIGGDGGKGATNSGNGGFTAATGGRQNQGGFGGISGAGPTHNGLDADRGKLGKAGNGRTDNYGGGGGGSGYYSGGGGQGGVLTTAPDGGGAGGSNFTGGMHSGAQSTQGTGTTGNGSVEFFWQNDHTNAPPTPPSGAKVNGRSEQPGMSAGSLHDVTVTADGFDSDKDKVHLHAEWSVNKNFNNPSRDDGPAKEVKDKPVNLSLHVTGLQASTHYYMRLWVVDEHNLRSLSYRAIDFWTNRAPQRPTLTNPPNYMMFPNTATLDFSWDFNDQDEGHQSAFALRYRVAGTPTSDPKTWKYVGGRSKMVTSGVASWSIPGETFLANYTYEWQVRTRDTFNKWSNWSDSRRFSTTSTTTAPELETPENHAALVVGVDQMFTWKHVNWKTGQVQYTADLRYRVWDPDVLDDDAVWHYLYGTIDTPGAEMELLVPAQSDFGNGLTDTFEAGVTYAWQARTYAGGDATNPSQWSDSFFFHGTPQEGSGLFPDPGLQVAAGPLGCGNNRVFIAERGGQRLIGEVTPVQALQWSRLRDDISSCTLSSAQFGDDCGELLQSLRTWQHEVVIYRDGVRVWEGPIVRIAYYSDHVEVEAKDILTYVYRRVMRVGYNDTYRKVHGVIVNREGRSVVERATLLVQNALCYDDPNILQYLTRLDTADDAKQARSIAAFQKTAWEEIDDLAATAGLDYTVVGRRIVFNDTHNPIGRLPVMRAGDFSADPVVTEYGMALANVFFVTSVQGQWGSAYPSVEGQPSFEGDKPLYYPFVELLTSAYGETAEDAKNTVTADKKVSLSEKLASQAARHISGRWPAPVTVRVPDNAILSTDLQLGINQLVPGVWVPLQAGGLRPITQWQKLDAVTVSQAGDTPETIAVIMSPAPLDREDDPDSGSGATDGGEAT